MAAVSISQTRHSGQRYLKEHIAPCFCRLMPKSHITFYEGAIAATMPVEQGTDPAESDLEPLRRFAEEEFLSVGISFSFNNIEYFPEHYRQSLSAVSLARRLGVRERVCLFRDYMYYDVLSECPGEKSLCSRCHPALQMLRLHDTQNGSELYNTLRCYIDNGGSAQETAKLLYIHRNSLNYRLDSIAALTGLEIKDPRVRYILKMSFDIDRFSGMAD